MVVKKSLLQKQNSKDRSPVKISGQIRQQNLRNSLYSKKIKV